MQTITVTLNSAKNSPPIELGHQGENLATTIQFDVTAWAEEYGNGSVVLLNQRKNEAPYPVVVEKEENTVTWDVTNVDTGIAGTGWCELQYYVGNVLAKSDKWRTITKEALGESGDAPEPWEGFLDEVTSLTARSETAATNAAQSAAAAASSESTVEGYKNAAETAAANAAASQALADQYAAAAANAQSAAEAARDRAETAQTDAEAAKAAAQAAAQAAAADKLAADASAAAAQASKESALASQAAAAASAAAAAGSEQSAADNAAAAIAARDAAQRAQEAAQASQTAAESSAAAAANSATAAQNSAAAAAQSAQAAAASATGASGSATAAESWAVGGTGTRAGEDTDNAQYYATQSASSASSAAQSAAAAQEAQVKAPIIQNRTWWVWSQTQGQYVDTGVDAGGRVEFESLTEQQKIELEQSIGANPLSLSGASVGDFAQITETDANGVPTRWASASTVDALGLSIVNGQLCITYEEAV